MSKTGGFNVEGRWCYCQDYDCGGGVVAVHGSVGVEGAETRVGRGKGGEKN